MTVTIWRLVKARHAGQAFDGEGARRYGGRWNSPGTPMVYASESRALAALELLVHVPANLLSQPFRFFRIDIPPRFIRSLTPGPSPHAPLPSGWNAPLISPATQALGDEWIASGRSVVLRVPSAVIPEENNYLINPAHPDFKKLAIAEPEPFSFDPRIAVKSKL